MPTTPEPVVSSDDTLTVEYGHRVHPVLHVLAPVATIAFVWGAKTIINRAYERVSGRSTPDPTDPRTSWTRALAWTAVTTAAAAVVEVSVRRLANERQIVRILRRDHIAESD